MPQQTIVSTVWEKRGTRERPVTAQRRKRKPPNVQINTIVKLQIQPDTVS